MKKKPPKPLQFLMKKKPTRLPSTIYISVEQRSRLVKTADYITAKTKQLREFGYADLTEDAVREQLQLIVNGSREIGEGGLSVVGGFMVDDIIK